MRSWEQTNLFSVLPTSRVGYYVGKAILSAFCCLSNRQCKQYFMSRPANSEHSPLHDESYITSLAFVQFQICYLPAG